MKIVTFNLRCDNDGDGENRFQFRKGLILDKIEAEKPDILGFQEVLPVMSDFLRTYLLGYECVGCGRGEHFDGENNMIAYRRDRFELMSLETFWLSPTPNKPGSRYAEQSDCPRVCTHAMLRLLGTDRLLHMFNTHLDHISSSARVLGAQAVMRKVDEAVALWPAPVILTGDMNDGPASDCIAVFRSSLTDQTPGFKATWHGWGTHPDADQIDFIFTRGMKAAGAPVAWSEKPYGKFLSDHDALEATLDFEN